MVSFTVSISLEGFGLQTALFDLMDCVSKLGSALRILTMKIFVYKITKVRWDSGTFFV